MCIICVELIKQKMTLKEASQNLREGFSYLTSDVRDHYDKLDRAIRDLDKETLEKMFDEAEEGYEKDPKAYKIP